MSSPVSVLADASAAGLANLQMVEDAILHWREEKAKFGAEPEEEIYLDYEDFVPFPGQIPVLNAVLNDSYRMVIVTGGYGSSKSSVLSYGFAQLTGPMADFSGNSHPEIIGVTSHMKQMCDDTLQPMIFEFLRAAYPDLDDRELKSNTLGIAMGNLTYRFHPSEQTGAWTKLKGRNWLASYNEEAELAQERYRRQVVTRCRRGNGKILMAANPTSTSTDWYKNWIAKTRQRQVTIHMTLFDNLALTEQYIREQCETLDPNEPEFRQDILGQYTESYAHKIYTSYEVVLAPNEGKVGGVLSMDFARAGANAALWIDQYRDGSLWVSDEWSFDARKADRHQSIEEITQSLLRWLGDRAPRRILVDPTSAIDLKEEIRRLWPTVPLVYSKNDREQGTRATRKFLESRVVRVDPKCKTLIEDLEAARYDQKSVKSVPIKRTAWQDHHVDALRYFCLTVQWAKLQKKTKWLTRKDN